MAFYIGAQQYNVFLGGIAYCLNIFSSPTNESDIVLLSSDGYTMADLDGIILLPKAAANLVIKNEPLATSEDYLLKDQGGYYLTLKESE